MSESSKNYKSYRNSAILFMISGIIFITLGFSVGIVSGGIAIYLPIGIALLIVSMGIWQKSRKIKKNEQGQVIYHGKKGDFTYGTNIAPEYTWFNGKVRYTLLSDKIENPEEVLKVNEFDGSADDGISRIWPVKIFRGKQPYDPVNKTLVVPHTAGKDDDAYWKSFDWNKSISHGMKTAGLPFSGEVDFIQTEMSWPITHMVAPAEDALTCSECHTENGRLQNIKGIYIPGRDSNHWLDKAGWIVVLLSLIGVLIHGGIRILMRSKKD